MLDQNNSVLKDASPVDVVKTSITKAGRIAFLMLPFDHPPALQQTWCLMELAVAAQATSSTIKEKASSREVSSKFYVCLPKSQQEAFDRTFHDNFDKLLKAINAIDIKQSQAPNPQDKKRILENSGDLDVLHVSCLYILRQWLKEAGENYLQRMRIEKGPEHPRVALMLNNLAMLMNDMGRDEEAADYANKALDIIQKSGHRLASVD